MYRSPWNLMFFERMRLVHRLLFDIRSASFALIKIDFEFRFTHADRRLLLVCHFWAQNSTKRAGWLFFSAVRAIERRLILSALVASLNIPSMCVCLIAICERNVYIVDEDERLAKSAGLNIHMIGDGLARWCWGQHLLWEGAVERKTEDNDTLRARRVSRRSSRDNVAMFSLSKRFTSIFESSFCFDILKWFEDDQTKRNDFDWNIFHLSFVTVFLCWKVFSIISKISQYDLKIKHFHCQHFFSFNVLISNMSHITDIATDVDLQLTAAVLSALILNILKIKKIATCLFLKIAKTITKWTDLWDFV